MSSPLRLTGENPTPELLKKHPNWEYALDEEEVDGQDETTLRPAEVQSAIVEYVCKTAATAWLNNGCECPAIIELVDGVGGAQFYFEGRWYQIIRWTDQYGQFVRWEPYVENWLSEDERTPSFRLTDEKFFPLHFASHLPYHQTLSPIKTTILQDGGEDAA
jgi:hypothetical protein